MLVVLHHAGEVRADLHAGDDPAAVHVERPDQGTGPILDRRLDHPRIDHGPQRHAAMHAAGGDDDGLPGPDVNRLGALVDVAVLPEAFQTRARFRVHPRRVAGFDPENPARERLLPDELVHVAVEDEPDALLPGAELQRPRDGETAIDPARCAERLRAAAGNGAHRVEGRMPLRRGISPVLRRQRAGLDVGLVGHLHDGPGGPGAGHPAALMGAVDPREPDVIVHHELPDLGRVVGPGAMELAVVVAVPGDAGGIDHRPVGHVPEQAVGVVFQILRLDARGGQPHALGVGRGAVPFLYGVAAAERGPAAAVHQLAADVEVLVDDEHGRPEIACPDGGMQPDAAGPEDDHVRFIVPSNALAPRASPAPDRTAAPTPAAAPVVKKSRRLRAFFA